MNFPRIRLLVVIFLSFMAHGDTVNADDALRRGYEAFEGGDFATAEKSFRESNSPDALLGLGASLYRQEKFDEALKAFRAGEEKTADPRTKSLLRFNTGNALAQIKRYDEALAEYKESMKLDPTNRDAKTNHDYVERLIPPPPKSSQPQGGAGESGKAPQEERESETKDANDDPESAEPEQDEPTEDRSTESPTPSPVPGEEPKQLEPNAADERSTSNLLDSVQESYDGLQRYRKNVARAEQRRSQQLQSQYDW